MAVVQGIAEFVRGINDRRRNARVDDALKNYLTAPDATIAEVMQFAPQTGIVLNNQRTADQMKQAELANAQRESLLDATSEATRFLRGLPPGSDLGQAIEGMSPYLANTLGMTPDQITSWRNMIVSNPSVIDALDDDVNKERAKTRFGTIRSTPGTDVLIGGKVVHRTPFAKQYRSVRRGDGGYDVVALDPNEGEAGAVAGDAEIPTGMGTPFTMDVETLRPHFVAQESRGDYTARNAETGALGAYQVMPETGATLARRLGMPWRPDMMQSDSPAARRYQDAIGGAAIQEAIEASGGDPSTAFMYYHGGSNRNGWGPRTRRYAEEMNARLGGGEAAPQQRSSGAVYSTPAAPSKRVRSLSAEEVAARGYPAGTVVQVDANGKESVTYRPSAARASGAKTPTQAAKDDQKEIGRTNLTNQIARLASSYEELAERGGIVDPNAGPVQNLRARAESSWLGQTISGALGSEDQAIRQEINNLQPLLINGIREATGMSSKAMDSNNELKFYLQAATDPSRDVISNLAAAQVLDETYGTGTALKQALSPEMYERVVNRAGALRRGRRGSLPKGDGQASGPPVGTIIRKGNERRRWNGRAWVKVN